MSKLILTALTSILISQSMLSADEEPLQISGVYPHLRMWNDHGEAGTGAVVPWQGDLWAITYAPHMPTGSTDKLYRITPSLEKIIFEDSVGGTPANRMIHRESNQLLIGPYVINAEKNIRVISPSQMFGRLTGTARHLTDPENKVYYATMEEGLYEVDVNTLEVTPLIRDGHGNAPEGGVPSELPGYHGKGLFTGQGKLVYSNNGEKSADARQDPTIASGALAEWTGEGSWQLVRRNQFTEVSGPGGIYGNPNPETDPLWAMGWDQKSLMLALLEDQDWHFYRLPKGSHSYDGAHGWNTEWPRIREIGEPTLLATMHGTFWHFPAEFSRENSAGIRPRSNYLKVIGDFCRWNDRLVIGCDDSAQKEFLNTRPFKAEGGAPLQSNSNFWFIEPEILDQLGPAIGRGSVWLREDLQAGSTSEPYLFSGYDHRQITLTHQTGSEIRIQLEVDADGNDEWTDWKTVTLPAGEPITLLVPEEESGTWIRARSLDEGKSVTVHFHYRNDDPRDAENDVLFTGLTPSGSDAATTGVMRSLAYDKLGLVTTSSAWPDDLVYYEIDSAMNIVKVDAPAQAQELVHAVRQPDHSVTVEEASVLIIEDGNRYRLPLSPDFQLQASSSEKETGGKTLQDVLSEGLALDASVEVSSVHSHFVGDNAVDGLIDEESRWIGSRGEKSSITLDFGSPVTIESLWVVSGLNRNPASVAKAFDIQVQEGGEWKTVSGGNVRGNNQVELELRFATPLTTSSMRIASKEEDYFRIYEIAAFSSAPDITPPVLTGLGPARICREVATERDLLNVHGTFYELPARNAQGLAKVRPVATHNLAIQDYCSHNGLLLFTGLDAKSESEHIFRSDDGEAAVWAGVIDDLWKLGKPRGHGGPWHETKVAAGEVSDPYLMTAYDEKSVTLSSSKDAELTLEVDIDGTGLWVPYKTFQVAAGETLSHEFEAGFSAYWVRAVSGSDSTVSVIFDYR